MKNYFKQLNRNIMVVQNYLRDEFLSPVVDGEDLQEVNSLIEELGLSCGNKINPEKSQVPFDKMDYTMIRTFKTLCPNVIDHKKYPHSIPLESLRMISLCEKESYFDSIEVWYTDVNPDPFLIGKLYKDDSDREKGYSWNMESYLISRWGPEARTMEELVSDAKVIVERNLKANYIAIKMAAEEGLKNVELAAELFLSSKSNNLTYPSIGGNVGGGQNLPF